MTHRQATLCYILDAGRLLLIRKKRGIGQGKINAPGGKVDPADSSVEAAAIRETREEVGVTPLDLIEGGELDFHFADGVTLHCIIFLARGYVGQPRETDEALPLWFSIDALPYGEMWEDDREWLPLLLAGKRFRGFVTVSADNQRATGYEIEAVP